MSPIRQINSPGVQLTEIDISQNPAAIVGTNGLVVGFADEGVELDPLSVTSMEDYQTNFGKPTNEAERYSYYAAKELIQNGGNLTFAKLPYNNNLSNFYNYMTIDLEKAEAISADAPPILHATEITGITDFTEFQEFSVKRIDGGMGNTVYDQLKSGIWPASIGGDYVIVDDGKSVLSNPNEQNGLIIGVMDYFAGCTVQRAFPSAEDKDPMNRIMNINSDGTPLNNGKFEIPLSGTFIEDSISEIFMKQFPTLDFVDKNGKMMLDEEYASYIAVIIAKTVVDPTRDGKIAVSVLEAFVGSLDPKSKNQVTNTSEYIGDIINSGSSFITFYGNLDDKGGAPSDFTPGIPLYNKDKNLDLFGFNEEDAKKVIEGNKIQPQLEQVFHKLSNIDDIQVDIVVDAGLSTIAQFCTPAVTGVFGKNRKKKVSVIGEGQIYDPKTFPVPETKDFTIDDTMTWRTIATTISNFCSKTRKDCFGVIDATRSIVLEGNQKYIRKTKPENTFSNTVAKNLKYNTGLNNSYVSLYMDWMYMQDGFSGKSFWIPESIKLAGNLCYNDATQNMWTAPAGINYGVVAGCADIAVNPSQKESDQIYMKNMNYAKISPINGITIEGQKTTQTKSSATDRINVRRLLLRLERFTYQTSKTFVYEPNNLFTRRRVVDALNPTFQNVMARGGLYDYRIICDGTNNGAEVIDRNELKITILVKPVRTAEFILCDFFVTRTSQNFDEVVY